MIIRSLFLKDFRNYSEFEIDFSSGLNFILGDNGQGKTNLIESLYFSTHLKSFRTSRLGTVCRRNCASSRIATELSKQNIDQQLGITIDRGRKKVVLNGRILCYISDFARSFFSLLFAPDQLVFFKEYPSARRAYFDRLLFLVDSRYCIWIKEFNRIKKQKSILLKRRERKGLDVWNGLLSEIIPKITAARSAMAERINRSLSAVLYRLTGRSAELLIGYRDGFGGKVEMVSSEIDRFLYEKKERECESGYMHYGPHKDDFWISMDGNSNGRSFSQGEYRISFLSLQLAVNRMISKEMRFRPILLLDDILSELDANTCLKFVTYIADKANQVFIASTSVPKRFLEMGTAYSIGQGRILGTS